MDMSLMALSEAAAQLHCSKRWLADNLRAGRFPAKKIGRRWMLTDDDIATILQLCSVMPIAMANNCSAGRESSTSLTQTTLRRLQRSKSPR
jgi:hypothetical protein